MSQRQFPLLTSFGWSLAALVSTILMFAGFMVSATVQDYNINVAMTEPVQEIYIEPAGYAFAIWLPIYVGYMLFGFFQFSQAQRLQRRYQSATPFVILNSISNIGWFYAVSLDSYLLQVFFIVGMLLTLIMLNDRLELAQGHKWTVKERAVMVFPISIYLGWITAATTVNVTFWLARDFGISSLGIGPVAWSVLVVFVATSIFAALTYQGRINNYTTGAGTWALIAIALANLGPTIPIGIAAIAGASLLIFLVTTGLRQSGQNAKIDQ